MALTFNPSATIRRMNNAKRETATLAGGCFWCTEAVFKRLKGVETVLPGYSGGDPPTGGENPTYDQVSTGTTGFAEAIQITFDPSVISYDKLLDVFFATHDPTTKNRQGEDVGTQYRSVIFYHNNEQKLTAEEKIKTFEASGKFGKIVTELVGYTNFYEAESSHKDYYDANRYAPYCTLVIDPKIKKLYKDFKEDVKKESK